jgi:hypothetical protein
MTMRTSLIVVLLLGAARIRANLLAAVIFPA